MQLSLLYTNHPKIFPPIDFYFNSLNVIFAKVQNPTLKDRDSHNLGKTFLARVIDYCLLGKITKEHPFKSRADLFGEFVFYIELLANSGAYVTIKREVNGKISITVDDISQTKLHLEDEDWDYPKLGFERARARLSELLALDVLEEYSYRKGLSYQLRTQSDYFDEFQTTSFGKGKHKEWKPFIAMLFGFDHQLILQKYEKDEEIKREETYRDNRKASIGSRAQYDEIRGLIDFRESQLAEMTKEVNQFSFRKIESSISETVVKQIDERISTLNRLKYKLDYEIGEIQKSMESNYIIDVDDMMTVFSETQVAMPEALVRSYKDLEEFNRQVSIERMTQLQQLLSEKEAQTSDVQIELENLDQQRMNALSILAEKETLKKYQRLQREIVEREREITELKQRLSSLDEISNLNQRINQLKLESASIATQIEMAVKKGESNRYREIRRKFISFVQEVINAPAQIHIAQNQSGNLDFKVTILEETTNTETSESEGTSYKKILAVCYDLAVMCVYADSSYYRFVYHDGVFEGLDNRKKVNFLNLVRRLTQEYKIQYILTVIDSDLPRDSRDNKLMFSDNEVVRQLHDSGNDGRLFRMEKF